MIFRRIHHVGGGGGGEDRNDPELVNVVTTPVQLFN